MDSKYIDWFKFGDENISFVNGMALLTLIPWIKSFNCYDYHNDVILRSPLVGLCKRYPGAWLQPNLDGHTVHSWNIFSYCSAGKSLAWLVKSSFACNSDSKNLGEQWIELAYVSCGSDFMAWSYILIVTLHLCYANHW